MTQAMQIYGGGAPALPGQVNAGATVIETQRAISETQGKISTAKLFPRNEQVAFEKLMFACSQRAFAEAAFYSVPRGGKNVSGPSIRLAEEIARVYGNFTYGHRELSRDKDKSEIEVFAWDVENNNYTSRQITVMHIMDTKSGGYKLTNQADIDSRIANVASKQARGRILALLPKWMLQAAIERCQETLVGDNSKEEMAKRIQAMLARFDMRGVSQKEIEVYLGHPVDMCTGEELVDLSGVYNAIKEGVAPSEFFVAPQAQQGQVAERLAMAIETNTAPAPAEKKPAARPRKTKSAETPATPAAAEPAPETKDEQTAQQAAQPENAQPQQTEDAPQTAGEQQPDDAPAQNAGESAVQEQTGKAFF